MAFTNYGRTSSDVEPMETDEQKEEMQKVTCQSYLLNEIQHELLSGEKKDALVAVEKEFNVKGKIYQYTRKADIPVVFEINQLTSLSCVVSNDPENIPLDSLISIDWNKPTSDYTTIWQDEESNQILECNTRNIPMNHRISILVHETQWNKPYSWNVIIKCCLQRVFKNDGVSHTIGFSLPAEFLVEFSESIVTVFQNGQQSHDNRPIYILLFVKTEKIKLEGVKILKEISNSNPDVRTSLLPKAQEISSSAPNDQCTVDVIEGSITEIAVDVIVSSNMDFHAQGLSRAIQAKAGKEVKDECERQYQKGIRFPEIAVTHGYALRCKYIFFGIIPYKYPGNNGTKNISIFVEKCLEKALDIQASKLESEKDIFTIAFPALGTGQLGYEPHEAAAQMEEAIAKFKAQAQPSSLKQILIVIYPQATGMDAFFELKNKFAKSKDSKGAIPKIGPESSHPIEQKKWKLKYDYNPLQWVQFLNSSGKRETLDEAINQFKKYLSTSSHNRFSQDNGGSLGSKYDSLSDHKSISITSKEVKELLLFYDFSSVITDINEQFSSIYGTLLVPVSSADQFERKLTEFRNLRHANTLTISRDLELSSLEDYLVEIRQQYPTIKCVIGSSKKEVLFRGLTFEDVTSAKYQLECSLGLRENVSVSHDRFTESSSSSEDKSVYSTVPSGHQPEMKSVYSAVTTFHQPDVKSVHSTVPSYHQPEFKSVHSTVPSYHQPEVKSVHSTVPSYHQPKEVSNESVNIPYQQERVSNLATDSQNNKDTQDTDCFPIEDGFLVKVYQGNILTANVEGIVNAANKWLRHGAGLARAIIKAAGDVVDKEGQDKLRDQQLNDGDVLSTSAGNLKQYKYIIHAVGPMRSYTHTDEYCRIKVAETVCNSLKEASQLGLFSVALPAISSAIFAVPIDVCTDGYFKGVMEFCKTRSRSCQLKEVHFVDLNPTTINAIKNHFANKIGNATF